MLQSQLKQTLFLYGGGSKEKSQYLQDHPRFRNEEFHRLYREITEDLCHRNGVVLEPQFITPFPHVQKEIALLVELAEVCLKLEYRELELCQKIIDQLFGESFMIEESESDVFIRGCFVRGLLALYQLEDEEIAQGSVDYRFQKGNDLVEYVLDRCVRWIVLGIETALKDQKLHSYLVHDGSLHYWNVVRRLSKFGTRKHLVDSWSKVCNALDEIQDTDKTWIVRNYVNLSLAYEDAQQSDLASKTLSKAQDSLKNTKLSEANKELLLNRIFRAQIHICRNAKKSPPSGSNQTQKILQTLQLIKSGMLTDKSKMEKDLELAYQSIIKGDSGKAKDKKKTTDEESSAQLTDEQLLLLSEISVISANFNFNSLTESIIKLTKPAKDLHPRIYRDYAVAIQTVNSLVDKREKLTNEMAKNRVKAINSVIKAIMEAKGLEPEYSGDVILEGVAILWNLSLPLLNDNLRKFVQKPFYQAAAALEEYDSHDINNIRAKILYEASKCDSQDELLSKALVNVKKALKLDYLEEGDEIRPLDRYLIPEKKRLDLKVDVYKIPENPSEEAYLLIEQAKGAANTHLKKSLLEQAIAKLPIPEYSSQPLENETQTNKKDPKKDKKDKKQKQPEAPPVNEEEVREAKERLEMWFEVLKTSWGGKFKIVSMVHQAAKVCFDPIYDSLPVDDSKDLSLLVSRGLGNIIIAEAYILELLEEEGLSLDSICEDDDEEGPILIQEVETKLSEYIQKALSIAMQCKQDWIIYNCCVVVWNYHLSIFQDRELYFPFLEILEKCYDALIFIEKEMKVSVDNLILSRIAAAYIFSLMQKFAVEKITEEISPSEKLGRISELANSSNVNNTELKKAISVATEVLNLIKTPMLGKFIIYQHALISYVQTMKFSTAPFQDKLTKLINYCGTLKLPEICGNKNEFVTVLNNAMVLLREIISSEAIHPEIFYLLTKAGIVYQENAIAVELGELLKDHNLPPLIQDDSKYMQTQGQKTKREWRWFSFSLMNYIQGIYNFLDPLKQNQSTQVDLMKKCLHELVFAMRTARFSNDIQLVVRVGQLGITCLAPLMELTPIRSHCAKDLDSLLQDASHFKIPKGDNSAIVFETLHVNLITCHRDTQSYSKGLKAISRAMKQLPLSHHKKLWQLDLEFRSLAGQDDVKSRINRVKGYNPATQANVYAMIGQCSSDHKLQKKSFLDAINVLSSDRSEQAKYMLEYGIWLYYHGYDDTEITDVLMNANDILDDLDFKDEYVIDDAGAKSIYSRQSSSKRSSRRNPSIGKTKSQRSAISRRSRASQRSKTGSRTSQRTGMTTLIPSSDLNEEGPLSLSQLDTMTGIHSLLGLSSLSTDQRVDYILTAHFYYLRMLAMGFEYVNEYKIKQAKLSVTEGSEMEEIVPFVFPSTIEDWFHFEFPDEMIEVWNVEMKDLPPDTPAMQRKIQKEMNLYIHERSRYALKIKNFPMPERSMYFIDHVIELLEEQSLYGHCIPLLHLKWVIAKLIVKNDYLVNLVYLQFSFIFEKLSLAALSKAYRTKANSLKLSTSVIRLKEEEYEMLRSNSQTSHASTNSKSMFKFVSLEGFTDRAIWIQQSFYLFLLGEFSLAKQLANHSLKDSIAYQDAKVRDQSRFLLSQIHYLQGNFAQAVSISCQARSHSENSIKFVIQCCLCTINSLYQSSNQRTAEAFIKQTFQSLNELLNQCKDKTSATSNMINIAIARFEREIAKLYNKHHEYPQRILTYLQSAKDRFSKHHQQSVDYVDCCYRLGKFIYGRSLFKNDSIVKETSFSRIITHLEQAIDVLEEAKVAAENVLPIVIPPGSTLSERYPISGLLANILISLGEAELLLYHVEIQLNQTKLHEKQKKLKENVNYPKMKSITMEDGTQRHVLADNDEDGIRNEVVEEFFASVDENYEPNTKRLEKSLALFTTASNLTCIMSIKNQAQTLVAQTLGILNVKYIPWLHQKRLQVSDMMQKSIDQHLQSAFISAFASDDWHMLAKIALELAHLTEDEQMAANLINFSQSMVVSEQLKKKFTRSCLENHMERIYFHLVDYLEETFQSPSSMLVYQNAKERLEKLSMVYSYLSPSSLMKKQEIPEKSKGQKNPVEETIEKPTPAIVCNKFVDLLPPSGKGSEKPFVSFSFFIPPHGMIPKATNYIYSSVLINLQESDPIKDKKAAKKGKKEPETVEEEYQAPKKFIYRSSFSQTKLQTLIDRFKEWKEILKDGKDHEDEWNTLIKDIDEFFQPIIGPLAETIELISPVQKSETEDGISPSLVLSLGLQESLLSQLPLEQLSVFKNRFTSISRDFSALTLYQRIKSMNGYATSDAVDWNEVTYLVDPHNQFITLSSDLLSYKQDGWVGIYGGEESETNSKPSINDFQAVLTGKYASNSQTDTKKKAPAKGKKTQVSVDGPRRLFLYNGKETLLDLMQGTENLCCLNLSEWNSILMIDQMDENVRMDDVELCCALLSLRGVRTVGGNQFFSVRNNMAKVLCEFFNNQEQSISLADGIRRISHQNNQHYDFANLLLYGIP